MTSFLTKCFDLFIDNLYLVVQIINNIAFKAFQMAVNARTFAAKLLTLPRLPAITVYKSVITCLFILWDSVTDKMYTYELRFERRRCTDIFVQLEEKWFRIIWHLLVYVQRVYFTSFEKRYMHWVIWYNRVYLSGTFNMIRFAEHTKG